MRERALAQFRSWGTMLNHVGLFQFWGLWPSNLTNIKVSLYWLNQQEGFTSFTLIFSLILIGATLYGYFRLLSQKVTFLLVWIPVWMAFLIVMHYAATDSYYVYKFYYINAWLIVLATVIGLSAGIKSQRRIWSYPSRLLLVAWIGVNFLNNLDAFKNITLKPYNSNYDMYRKVIEIPPELLADTYIDIPFYDHHDVTKKTLAALPATVQSSKATSKYLLEMTDNFDALPQLNTPVVWQSDAFTLRQTPPHNILELASYWAPEKAETTTDGQQKSFRWISDVRNGYLILDIHQRDHESNYLYFCAESGPSVNYETVYVEITDAKNRHVGTMNIGPYKYHWLDIRGYEAPFSFSHESIGIPISVIEPRKLIYRIFEIGVSEHNGEQATFIAKDIIKHVDFESGTDVPIGADLQLGEGWQDYEFFEEEYFRWAGNSVGLLVKGPNSGGTLLIELDIAPGPSLGRYPLQVEVFDESERLIYTSAAISMRGTVTLPLNSPPDEYTKFHLRVKSENLALLYDPRILNFRVFSIKILPLQEQL
jgi:hypothetical protein